MADINLRVVPRGLVHVSVLQKIESSTQCLVLNRAATILEKMLKKVPNAIDKFVGDKIKARRLQLRLNQTELATPLNVTYQQVQKYEAGASRIGAGRLQHISHVLQVPVAFFFEGAPRFDDKGGAKKSENLPDYAESFITTPEGLAIAKAFTEIGNSKIKDCIANLIQCMASVEASK
jgi:transcriptional regulator with XRE-family HTH domain